MSEDLQSKNEVFSQLSMGDSAPLGSIIDLVECRVNTKKALKKLGLKRKKIDRLWSRKQVVDNTLLTEVVELCRCLERYVFEDSKEAQTQVQQLVEKLYPSGEPQEVRVTISGPAWLDASIWMPDGEIVPPSMARAILHRLDGVWLDGVAVEVVCAPPIRPGKKPQRRSDEKTRRRRLFSRWYEGIRSDEEGLYSLTPEALAVQMVRGLEGVVVDGTCGLGALNPKPLFGPVGP